MNATNETPAARCGRTDAHGAHRTHSRPGWCAGNVGVITARVRCDCGRTVWTSDALDICPECGQFNPMADAAAMAEYRETLHRIHVRRGVFVPSCDGCATGWAAVTAENGGQA